MQVFTFDYDTGAYTGPLQLGVGDCDPRSPGAVLIPGNATVDPPPRCGVGLWPFWRDGQWQVFEEIPTPGELFFTEYDNWDVA